MSTNLFSFTDYYDLATLHAKHSASLSDVHDWLRSLYSPDTYTFRRQQDKYGIDEGAIIDFAEEQQASLCKLTWG